MENASNGSHWSIAAKQAEIVPSNKVWEGVQAQLDRKQILYLQRNVFYYKLLAAACVLFAFIVVANSSWKNTMLSQTTSQVMLGDTILSSEPVVNNSKGEATSFVEREAADFKVASEEAVGSIVAGKSFLGKAYYQRPSQPFLTNSSAAIFSPSFFSSSFFSPSFFSKTENNEKQIITNAQKISGLGNTATASPIISSDVYLTEELNDQFALNKDAKKSKTYSEQFWTSVGVSAGTFYNVTPSGSNVAAGVLQSPAGGRTAASESNSSGYTYAVNLAVGTKVSKRWLLQGGISYNSQLSDYTATSVLADVAPASAPSFAAASLNSFEKKVEGENEMDLVIASSPYQVNNSIQNISFPIQAGYLVFERKMGLQINSGISTDLFLQNTITPKADNLEQTTQGRGDGSPYRPVNFSGLLGTEFSYRIGASYRISISPGVRYPFNSIYKTVLGIKSTPVTFDVALRFRYILK